jgi:hypothetical protein
MEKVKITREQAGAIEYCIEEYGKDKTINSHANGTWAYECEPLNNLDFSELAKALYVGYEVEPEFKIGEKIVDESDANKTIITVKGEAYGKLYGYWTDHETNTHVGTTVRKVNARHANDSEIAAEKERRWWSGHGKDVWDVENGDVIKKKADGFAFDVAVYGAEYIKNNRDRYEVVCFKKDRLDASE